MKVGIAGILAGRGLRRLVRRPGRRDLAASSPSASVTARRQPVIRASSACPSRVTGSTAGSSELPRVQGGLGVVIVSTSQGLLTDREARRRRLGGEVVCEVW